ncbi:glycosyltransferase [Microvirga pudoricolor]|uniref:glycosyltransferase n=1 Tax=Microvirga pudoricolor TaxID=2778729 RepID=UPI0019508E5C|nr:glycosyltransferase [Microvirga pudoricolor]
MTTQIKVSEDTLENLNAPRIAVLVPCYNEEKSVGAVIRDFKVALPNADIYVYDNNSSDNTIVVARDHGAHVRRELIQGKGSVVRRMFADVDADVYILVDGDATYHAASAPAMVQRLVDDGLDMVTGNRISDEREAYRRGHRFGNRVLTGLVASVFGRQITDMLSGYRVLSRRFVKSFPAMAHGFETETELTVHALELRMPIAEIDTPYGARPPGSFSKLSTYRDGIRILRMIVRLIKDERPLAFFSLVSTLLLVLAVAFAAPVFFTWLETGLVPRFPTAILATGLALLSFLSLSCGIVLDSVALGRREARRFAYLRVTSQTQ